MKIPSVLAKLKARLADRPIEINSSSSDENEPEESSSEDDEIENESDHAIVISSDDDDVIMVEPSSSSSVNPDDPMEEDDDRPLDDLVGSRQGSTDREVSADEIDLDNVRWASSSDDESEDPAVALREPNPMIPGKWYFRFVLYLK